MNTEMRMQGKTIDEAVNKAAEYFGVSPEELRYKVITEPKKGFLGIGEVPATIEVLKDEDIFTGDENPGEKGFIFVKKLIEDMSVDAEVVIEDKEDGKIIRVYGEDASVLIGHHGETLDALQHLVNIVANRKEEDGDREYTRITVDIEDYRKRRETTLRALASRISEKVLKNGKSVTLEPMSAYERRIIHSTCQDIEGVTTHSIGQDSNRRVVITPEK